MAGAIDDKPYDYDGEPGLELMTAIVEGSPNPFVLCNVNGELVKNNHAAQDLLHIGQDSPHNILELFGPDNTALLQDALLSLSTQEPSRVIIPRMQLDESTIISLVIDRISLKNGVMIGIYPRDISSEIFAQDLVEALFEKSQSPTIIYGLDGKFQLINPATAALLGYAREEVAGKPLEDYIKLTSEEAQILHARTKELANLALGETLPLARWVIPNKSGEERVLLSLVTKVMWNGQPAGIASFIDITALEQTRKLQLEQEELAAILNTLVGQFRELKHEAAAKLAAFDLLLTVLRMPQTTSERRSQVLDSIQDTAEALNIIITRFVDIARGLRGDISLDLKPVNPSELIQNVIATDCSQSLEEDSPHPITINISPDASLIFVDEHWFSLAVGNLLRNAVKYSPEGGEITVEVAAEGAGSSRSVRFSVHDRGIGIPPEEVAIIFESLKRGSNVGDIPGTGLGLALVRKLVELHGGTVFVESVLGEGSTFTIRIPYKKWALEA